MQPTCVVRPLVAAALLSALVVPAAARDRHLTVVNDTSFAIVELYGSRVGSDEWKANVLGDETLSAGASKDVVFEDTKGYCMFNLRAVFEDKDEVVTGEPVNVCDAGTFTYRE
jgi:hypothetical protein